jgi:endonuclease/exonuclease/phosphatase family metal-dependent hydrolase
MKIATWNLERVRPGVGARTERIRAALATIPADVWVLTETHSKFQLPEAYEQVASSSTATDRGPGEQWVSIWVRRSLHAVTKEVRGEPDRSAAVLVARKTGRDLVVFGTVLPWRGDRATADRGATKLEKSLAAQTSDWRLLSAGSHATDICIVGDFNQELSADGPVGTRRGRAALTRALEDHGLTCATSAERDPLRTWRASIDHVMLSTPLVGQLRGTTIWPNQFPLPKNMPDHHGVCVDLADA